MDPNLALENIRQQIENLRVDFENEDMHSLEQSLEVLEENFRGLDNWLTNGGFLPGAWSRGENA